MNPLSTLALVVGVPEGADHRTDVQVRPFVDGRDIVAEAFDAGPPHRPELLLGAHASLRAEEEPHEVELAEADCTVGCCGALRVTVRREGATVLWEKWRDANGPDPELPDFRFDAEAYDAEVERAERDHAWEYRGRIVARLLTGLLSRTPERLSRWACELGSVASRPGERDTVQVLLWHPRRPVAGAAFLQYRCEFPVTGDDPAAQADRLFETLVAADPLKSAELVGGSAAYARRLGRPWTPRR